MHLCFKNKYQKCRKSVFEFLNGFKMLSNETLIDIQEVANEFGKSVESIRKYKNFGIIRVSDKNGNKDLFDRSEILDIRIQLKELRLKGLTLSQIADEIESERKFENKTSPTFGPNSGSIVSKSHEVDQRTSSGYFERERREFTRWTKYLTHHGRRRATFRLVRFVSSRASGEGSKSFDTASERVRVLRE